MTGILIAGTSSDAGKSLFVTGLCRVARRRGINVAPFKAQNMSNNSMVCPDGAEIGRAQYLQALAAGLEPQSAMNPVLLKPGTDRRSFIVLRGEPAGTLESGQYATERRHLAAAAWAAYQELAEAHELVICEGAGSPAEINLRSGDYTNMGLARRFNLPVVLVGDIDRGGILASIFGTWGLLDPEDRALLAGYVINKFRGDQAILDPGLAELTRRTGLANLGVLPWLDGVRIDGEDSLSLGSRGTIESTGEVLTVAAIRLPRISNATDIDALGEEPGVQVVVTASPAHVAAADLVVVPGSRATLADLAWLHDNGLATALQERARRHRPVLGICGGYQMLSQTIDDEVEAGRDGIPPGSSRPGLGLLPATVHFQTDKVLRRPTGLWEGHEVGGYEIHHGRTTPTEDAFDRGAEPFLDGLHHGATWGTMWHGALEHDDFRRAWLTHIAEQSGSSWRPQPGAMGFSARREHMIDLTADAIETHIDVDTLLTMAR